MSAAQLDRNGVRIYFDDRGAGMPVVFGHSFLCSGDMWRYQIAALSERYRTINIDCRGHGRSGPAVASFTLYDLVDDVLAVLDHLEIGTAVWAGLSIGGMVALRAALRAPSRVAGLVLVDTHAGAETIWKTLKYRALAIGATRLGIRRFLPAVVPLMFGRTTLREAPELVREWSERFAGVHMPSVLAGLDALVRRDTVVDRLEEIIHPAVVIVGEEDRSLPPALSREIVEGLPNAELVTIPGAGHLSALEQPAVVTATIARFLAELDNRAYREDTDATT
ncbi:MAG TPA: alpha/beta fold hydrolase [Acidobacteriota bacterium]|nr:alpha/beta fold hydrolase [Acidobacteriota bacterium]